MTCPFLFFYKKSNKKLGEDVDDFIVQTHSKTQELIKDYTAVASNAYQGIDVLDANGNLRSTYDILLDIAKVYKEIQEEDKKAGTNRAQALVEYIAGKNRSNIAASILLNPEMLENVYKSSQTSEGSAQQELDKYLEGISGHVAELQNAIQELYATLLKDDTVIWAIDALKELIEIITSVVDKIGTLPSIGVVLGLRQLVTSGSQIKKVFSRISDVVGAVKKEYLLTKDAIEAEMLASIASTGANEAQAISSTEVAVAEQAQAVATGEAAVADSRRHSHRGISVGCFLDRRQGVVPDLRLRPPGGGFHLFDEGWPASCCYCRPSPALDRACGGILLAGVCAADYGEAAGWP